MEPNTSGRDTDDPIKLGDELRYKELTERMTSMESSMTEMKDMMKEMMDSKNAGKEKGIDETLNKKAEEISIEKQKRQDTLEAKASRLIKQEQAKQKKKEDIGTSQRRKSTRKVRQLIITPPKTSVGSIKGVSSTEPKPKPSPQKPPLKKQKKPSPPSPIQPTDAGTTDVSADVPQTASCTTVVSADVT
ncbi:transcription initiation factor TFIID subunit 3-like [Helianthus annuus]|uniref:transcription initiation factor TFIID subunit 3-like n=1 Tax=Helianthus annuus TaxID=4232 RepID=UPI000B8F5B05|nr:transcription initiation factor TFIID subunit 3-like [Helianthus annuus]